MPFWKKTPAQPTDLDPVTLDVLKNAEEELREWEAAGRPPRKFSSLPPLGSFADPDAERLASLAAAEEMRTAKGPGIGSVVAEQPRLTSEDEAFPMTLFELHEESMFSRTPFKQGICYGAAMWYKAGWSSADREEFISLLKALDEEAAAHPVGPDGAIDDEVKIAGGDLYRFLIRVGVV
jgi:hypothetical protein